MRSMYGTTTAEAARYSKGYDYEECGCFLLLLAAAVLLHRTETRAYKHRVVDYAPPRIASIKNFEKFPLHVVAAYLSVVRLFFRFLSFHSTRVEAGGVSSQSA